MTRAVVSLIAALGLAVAGLGAQQSGARVTRLGAARSFGPGILSASPVELRFELIRPAHVIVLQLDPGGGITPLFPLDTTTSLRDAGVHALTAPPPVVAAARDARVTPPVLQTATELARAGRQARPPAVDIPDTAAAVAYWLLIVSDAPTSGAELRAELESMRLNFRSVDEELRALPKTLVARRTKDWGAYYAPVF
jgi:hypothetical protein